MLVVHGASRWAAAYSNPPPNMAGLILDASERIGWALADRVVYPSAYMWRSHQKLWGKLQDSRTSVIHNIAPPIPARSRLTAGGAGKATVKSLAYVGVLNTRKGFDLFLDTAVGLARLRGDRRTLPLEAFGVEGEMVNSATGETAGPLITAKEFLALFAKRHPGVLIDLTIRGPLPQSELWPALRAAGALVLFTSRHENAPMVPIEASIAGVPFMGKPPLTLVFSTRMAQQYPLR